MTPQATDKEALRQQMFIRALWFDARAGVLGGWLRERDSRFEAGLAAYRAHAGATAERALAAAYPTLQELVGPESFGHLARALWRAHPPLRGDLAAWGGALPTFIAAAPSLADTPYLADVARLEWALHLQDSAADAPAAPQGLEQLAQADLGRVSLRLRPGLALVSSPHPVATLWQAHRSHAADRFVPVHEALAQQRGEHALVWREGFAPRVSVLSETRAAFMQALLDQASIEQALATAGANFDFEAWFIEALRCGWIVALAQTSPTLSIP
jgi:Putative DNA-binding domain